MCFSLVVLCMIMFIMCVLLTGCTVHGNVYINYNVCTALAVLFMGMFMCVLQSGCTVHGNVCVYCSLVVLCRLYFYFTFVFIV